MSNGVNAFNHHSLVSDELFREQPTAVQNHECLRNAIKLFTLSVSAIRLLIEHHDIGQLRQEIPKLLVFSHWSLEWAWSGCITSIG